MAVNRIHRSNKLELTSFLSDKTQNTIIDLEGLGNVICSRNRRVSECLYCCVFILFFNVWVTKKRMCLIIRKFSF